VLGAAFVAVLAVPVGAQVSRSPSLAEAQKDLPGWKVPEICAKDSAPGHCQTLESRAWRTVSGSWLSLPDSVKKICLGNVRSPADGSWRVLNDCIDEEMEKIVDRKAVSTRFTPGEAVPPPRVAPPPASANISVPPPILGMPSGPPPIFLDAEAAQKRLDAEREAKAAADRAAAEAAQRAAADRAAADRAAADRAAAEAAQRAQAERAAAEAARLKAAAEEAARIKAAEAAEVKRRAELSAAAKACEDRVRLVAREGVIRFAFARAEIDPQSRPTLDKVADAAKACPKQKLKIEGHTDSIGEKVRNQPLSEARAKAVLDYLVAAGIEAARLSFAGFADERPAATNDTDEGRAQNRRIEFVVSD
jgi:outer membrane protein OmpA-like peptidoglycan-associated protein